MVNISLIPLKIRQGFILIFLLIVVLPALFFSIEQAYRNTLINATKTTLETHLYSLISEMDFKDEIQIPNRLISPELTNKNSNTFALVYEGKTLIWYSESAVKLSISPIYNEQLIGIPKFVSVDYVNRTFWQLSLSVVLGDSVNSKKALFILLKDNASIESQMHRFNNTLINWMFLMAAVISAFIALGFIWIARPLQRLDKEIKAIESGERVKLSGDYPVELQTIKADLNLLLDSQIRQKSRFRSSLSDLTHALKTPLAVISTSSMAKDKDTQIQLNRINAIIEHQLKKAASGASDTWKKKTDILPVLDLILNAMKKVYHDKNINFSVVCRSELVFLGDKTDLMEILGNLIDNACKACNEYVQIGVYKHNRYGLKIIISDDGPGVPVNQREQLLTRGTRLDTYESGHGVGMAIVADLVNSYNGTLLIASSSIGGAEFKIEFNYEKH